jgi:hypothetical protein
VPSDPLRCRWSSEPIQRVRVVALVLAVCEPSVVTIVTARSVQADISEHLMHSKRYVAVPSVRVLVG